MYNLKRPFESSLFSLKTLPGIFLCLTILGMIITIISYSISPRDVLSAIHATAVSENLYDIVMLFMTYFSIQKLLISILVIILSSFLLALIFLNTRFALQLGDKLSDKSWKEQFQFVILTIKRCDSSIAKRALLVFVTSIVKVIFFIILSLIVIGLSMMFGTFDYVLFPVLAILLFLVYLSLTLSEYAAFEYNANPFKALKISLQMSSQNRMKLLNLVLFKVCLNLVALVSFGVILFVVTYIFGSFASILVIFYLFVTAGAQYLGYVAEYLVAESIRSEQDSSELSNYLDNHSI